jgi:Arc/MetJ-type ribon-helix-helix transcriptional regulator
MKYEFPIDLQVRLIERLEHGSYENEDEVLRDALDALDQLEQDKLTRWNERNQLAIEQSEQGLSKPLDDEKILSRLRDRLANEGILD